VFLTLAVPYYLEDSSMWHVVHTTLGSQHRLI